MIDSFMAIIIIVPFTNSLDMLKLKLSLLQVTVPLGTFQPAVASNNKKVAKAQAALAALQGLGLSSGSVEYSAS